MPEVFGAWRTIYTRFYRWSRNKAFQSILGALTKEADTDRLMIDSAAVKARQHAAGAKGGQKFKDLGRPIGGFSSKNHFIVDSHNNHIDCTLTVGQTSYFTQAIPLLSHRIGSYVIADRGYDSKEIRNNIKEIYAEPVIQYPFNRRDKGSLTNILIMLALLNKFDQTIFIFAAMKNCMEQDFRILIHKIFGKMVTIEFLWNSTYSTNSLNHAIPIKIT